MCGRFILMIPGSSLAEKFGLSEEPVLEPRYNIAPTQLVAIIRLRPKDPARKLVFVKWGLIPSWAKDRSIGPKLINARAESAVEKPAFRASFRYRRCLVPADGFYEWKRDPTKAKKQRKQPHLVAAANGEPLAFAGLWEHWESPEHEVVESCTILTTNSNELVQALHDRMPLILHEEDYDFWLDPDVKDPKVLKPLLRPYPSDKMKSHPVSARVNKADYDAPDCIERIFPGED
jgi:putative SOS response-associated peptidase YedK